MDNTLGIDCPQIYNFNQSQIAETPRRESADFFTGIVGDPPLAKKRRLAIQDENSRPCTRSLSTPRRSGRLQGKAEKTAAGVIVQSGVIKKIRRTAVRPRRVPLRENTSNIIEPKPNRTLELRKKATAASNNMSENKKPFNTNVAVMKPNFQKPKLHCTIPQTPEMIRRMRNKAKKLPRFKSFQEREAEEVMAMKSHTFKAASVPVAVSSKKMVPNRVKSSKPPTKPETPKITRGKKRKIVEPQLSNEFKAAPIPAAVAFKKVVPNRVKSSKPPTKPETPKITMGKRRAIVEPQPYEFKANPLPDFTKKPLAKPPRKTDLLRAKPFEMPGDAISKMKRERFQKKLKQEEEAKKARATFKASKYYKS